MKQKVKILIIEDERDLMDTLIMKLKSDGFVVDGVEDGNKAIKKMKEFKPDILLLDVILPGKDGKQILKEIKKDNELKKTSVIIISNSGQPVEIKELLNLGAHDYIIKANFTAEDILERIHNVLELKKGDPDIVIAEDEDFLRGVLAKKLRLDKHRVITATDGEIALRTVVEHKPRLLVLDLLMPGLSGIDVLEALKEEPSFDKKRTKIIVLSNYSGKENEAIIKDMTKGYFIKSNFDIDEIVGKIEEFLKG